MSPGTELLVIARSTSGASAPLVELRPHLSQDARGTRYEIARTKAYDVHPRRERRPMPLPIRGEAAGHAADAQRVATRDRKRRRPRARRALAHAERRPAVAHRRCALAETQAVKRARQTLGSRIDISTPQLVAREIISPARVERRVLDVRPLAITGGVATDPSPQALDPAARLTVLGEAVVDGGIPVHRERRRPVVVPWADLECLRAHGAVCDAGLRHEAREFLLRVRRRRCHQPAAARARLPRRRLVRHETDRLEVHRGLGVPRF